MTLQGLKADREPVPIPSSIPGKCVYGHIITDKHTQRFRNIHPDIEKEQTSDPALLVSIASLVVSSNRPLLAATAKVFVNGQQHVCLVHVDRRLPMAVDRRRTRKFMEDLEELLGIDEGPMWYPCYQIFGIGGARSLASSPSS